MYLRKSCNNWSNKFNWRFRFYFTSHRLNFNESTCTIPFTCPIFKDRKYLRKVYFLKVIDKLRTRLFITIFKYLPKRKISFFSHQLKNFIKVEYFLQLCFSTRTLILLTLIICQYCYIFTYSIYLSIFIVCYYLFIYSRCKYVKNWE